MTILGEATLEAGKVRRKGWQERLMGIFGEVRPEETVTTLLMLSNIFLILAGY